MGFFISLVLALVIAWLICQLIRKTWKPFLRSIPKFCKVMLWIIVILIILAVGFVIYNYVELYVCRKEFLVETHTLPSDIIPEIRKYGIRRWWYRLSKTNGLKDQEAIQKDIDKKKALAEIAKAKAEAERKERERKGLLTYKESTNIFQRIFLYFVFLIYNPYPD